MVSLCCTNQESLRFFVRGLPFRRPSWFLQGPASPGGVLGSGFAGYVPLAFQNPHSIIVYSVANYRPHLSHFWANVIVISRTELNASRLLIIKTIAGTIF